MGDEVSFAEATESEVSLNNQRVLWLCDPRKGTANAPQVPVISSHMKMVDD